LRVLSILLLDS